VKAPAECGTTSGWNRHRRMGETACLRCTEAKRVYDLTNNAPERVRRRKARSLAYNRANLRLRRMYPEVYRAIYQEELARAMEEEKE
jgi:hypothetical protein